MGMTDGHKPLHVLTVHVGIFMQGNLGKYTRFSFGWEFDERFRPHDCSFSGNFSSELMGMFQKLMRYVYWHIFIKLPLLNIIQDPTNSNYFLLSILLYYNVIKQIIFSRKSFTPVLIQAIGFIRNTSATF